ncbi:hypothetical protein [Patulibacter sp.]|uniref:hypothetical protein n=1 Tax=Patulibacter sp. TaxID=1912859 RepID=UPI00272119EA|nr:hypothetical protein [Patulibacter sp.]MDO9407270.1 hypothetical protein [Patulibacter sp.]
MQPGPEDADHDLVVVEDDGRYLRVSRPQARVLGALDGSCTIDEFSDRSGLPAESVRGLVAQFSALGVLVDAEAEEPPPPPPPKRLRFKEAGRLEFRVVDPDALIRRIVPFVRPLVHPVLIPLIGILLALSVLAAGVVIARDEPDIGLAFRPIPMVLLTVAMIGTVVLHELGHAVAVGLGGGRVRRMGVMVYYLIPAMFCDTSDSWRFPARSQRVMVAAAGLAVQLTLTGLVCQLLWLPLSPELQAFIIVYAGANVGLSIYNLLPLVKLDGYWMIVSGLDRSGLRERAIEAAGSWWRWPALGGERPRATPAEVGLALFGLACAIAGPALILYALWRYGDFLIDLGRIAAALWLLALMFAFWKPAVSAGRGLAGMAWAQRTRVLLVAGTAVVLVLAVLVVVDGTGEDSLLVSAWTDRLLPAWRASWS